MPRRRTPFHEIDVLETLHRIRDLGIAVMLLVGAPMVLFFAATQDGVWLWVAGAVMWVAGPAMLWSVLRRRAGTSREDESR